MVLFVNCCPRKNSRTLKLAGRLLKFFDEYEEIKLYESGLIPIDSERLEYRTAKLASGDLSDKMFDYARRFANADEIIIAAPFWDLSFPSMLKVYFENVYVTGIVSKYDEKGMPKGLCRAKNLYFVTTSGGPLDERFGYEYIRNLALYAFGVKNVYLFKAEMLDVLRFDEELILKKAEENIELFMTKRHDNRI